MRLYYKYLNSFAFISHSNKKLNIDLPMCNETKLWVKKMDKQVHCHKIV